MNPDILDKILRAIIVFLHVEKLGCTNSSWKRVIPAVGNRVKRTSTIRVGN